MYTVCQVHLILFMCYKSTGVSTTAPRWGTLSLWPLLRFLPFLFLVKGFYFGGEDRGHPLCTDCTCLRGNLSVWAIQIKFDWRLTPVTWLTCCSGPGWCMTHMLLKWFSSFFSWPTALKTAGYKPTSVKNMLTNAKTFLSHVELFHRKENHLTATQIGQRLHQGTAVGLSGGGGGSSAVGQEE